MKKSFVLILIFSISTTYAQEFNVNVIDGYGSGNFLVGDTVHVWAKEMNSITTFSTWTGDTNIPGFIDEWHTSFVMPAQDINLQAQFTTVGSLVFEYIQCSETIKPVYHHFPSSPGGIVFLFSGNMNVWLKSPDHFQLVKDLMASNIAIVITEAEEVTINVDIDGNGKHRWIKDVLTTNNNIDIRNIQSLIDTFENRSYIAPSIKKFAIGMSNGGAFAITVSYALSFDAAVPYCVRGNTTAISNTSTPIQWCMAKYDDNPNVGYPAYLNTLTYSANLNSNNVCSNVYLKDKSPIYPEIFARFPAISTSLSQDIFNELNSFGLLDNIGNYHYMNTYSSDIISQLNTYPILSNLNLEQLLAVSSQMDVTYAGHKFFSSHNKRTINFLFNPCSIILPTDENGIAHYVSVYPNPAFDKINVVSDHALNQTVLLINSVGQLVLEDEINKPFQTIDISSLLNGLYFLNVNGKSIKIIKN